MSLYSDLLNLSDKTSNLTFEDNADALRPLMRQISLKMDSAQSSKTLMNNLEKSYKSMDSMVKKGKLSNRSLCSAVTGLMNAAFIAQKKDL